MNIKHLILTIIIVLGITGFIWKFNLKSTRSEATSFSSYAEKLESNFPSEVRQDENWQHLTDYTVGAKDLVNEENGKYLFQFSYSNIITLESCLRKNLCGMEKREEDDSYFDEDKTPGHIFLARNLKIMLESLELFPELISDVDLDLFRELAENSNEDIKVLSLKVLKDYGAVKWSDYDLFKIADDYKGNAKAEALVELAKKDDNERQNLLMNSLSKSFAIDDPHTVISILENLKRVYLSIDQLKDVSKNLCHFKENGSEDPNWKMINYNMRKVEINIDKICTN